MSNPDDDKHGEPAFTRRGNEECPECRSPVGSEHLDGCSGQFHELAVGTAYPAGHATPPAAPATAPAVFGVTRAEAIPVRNHCDHEYAPHFGGPRPRVVTLCGSTRFYDQFQQANYDETMAGNIVLSVGFYPHSKAIHGHGEGVGHDSAEKVALDELHKRKIDMADEVLVVSDATGYYGDSTRSEIEYAVAIGKPVRYLVNQGAGGPCCAEFARTGSAHTEACCYLGEEM